MQMHKYLDLVIVLELRNPFGYFYTKSTFWADYRISANA